MWRNQRRDTNFVVFSVCCVILNTPHPVVTGRNLLVPEKCRLTLDKERMRGLLDALASLQFYFSYLFTFSKKCWFSKATKMFVLLDLSRDTWNKMDWKVPGKFFRSLNITDRKMLHISFWSFWLCMKTCKKNFWKMLIFLLGFL